MSRLETLLEQTEYLLKKQKQAKDYCNRAFADLLALIEQKIAQGSRESKQLAGLERVHDMLSGQAQKLMDDTQGDIEYLQEQAQQLRSISKMEDSIRAQAILNELIDPEEELLDTVEFIAGIDEEQALAQESLTFTINDIKDALQEGDFATIEAMLSSMATNDDLNIDFSEDDEHEEDGCCDDDAEEDGCCGSGACSEGGCGSCDVGGCGSRDNNGVDIFSQLGSYDRDLAKDEAKDKSKK